MKNHIHIELSPLTNTIFAGTVCKDQKTWCANKTDITVKALIAVAEHCVEYRKKTGKNVRITNDGELAFEIIVIDHREKS